MNYYDHNPPHFHAQYGGAEIVVSIQQLLIIRGEAQARVVRMVLEWAELHIDELLLNWERCRNGEIPLKLKGLV